MAKSIEIKRLSGAMGAEVFGIDLSKPLGNAETKIVRDAFYEHIALFFPGQQLSPQNISDFVSNFGEPVAHPLLKPIDPDFPFVHELRKEPAHERNYGGEWHMDLTFRDKPSAANSLYARVVPEAGGDTLFANLYLAYETLSDGMKAAFADMRAVHGISDVFKAEHKANPNRKTIELSGEAVHPVFRTIPETGRKALYVYRAQTKRFENMTAEESKPMIEFFQRHAERPEFQLRYHWRKDVFGIWDNRCCMHYALNDYPGELRVMHRMIAMETAAPV